MDGFNRFSSLEGLGKRRRDEVSSDQAQNESNSAISLLTDAGPPDSYVSSFSPASELESLPWTMNYTDMLLASEIEDCNSEALPNAKKRSVPPPELLHHHSPTSGEANQAFVMTSPLIFRREILADRVQNSIENLQFFCDRLSCLVGAEVSSRGYGESSAGLQGVLDPRLGDSVADSQVCHRYHGQFGVAESDVVCNSEDHHHTVGVDGNILSSDEGSWQWSRRTSLTGHQAFTAGSPVSRTEEGGESKLVQKARSVSTADLKDLVSSLHLLLSVLKNHEVMEEISRVKMQALRQKKEALRLAKQHYKDLDKHEVRRPVADHPCLSSLSQETDNAWLTSD